MRRTLPTIALSVAGLAVFAVPVHAGSKPPASTVPPTEDTAVPDPTTESEDTAATAEISAPAGSAVVVVDESGSELAALTVTNVEAAWTGYGENNDPQSGHEYLRVTVVVESRSPRGLFAIDAGDFILQDADGFVTRANVEPSAEQAANEQDPVTEAELANAASVEFNLTFEIVSNVAATAVFFSPSSDRLVTVYPF